MKNRNSKVLSPSILRLIGIREKSDIYIKMTVNQHLMKPKESLNIKSPPASGFQTAKKMLFIPLDAGLNNIGHLQLVI